MKIYRELSIAQFEAWGGGKILQQKIIDNGKENEFEDLIEELFPNGISACTLNDELSFNADWWVSVLNLKDSEEMKC